MKNVPALLCFASALAISCAFSQTCTVTAGNISLSAMGTASSGGFLPEIPQTVPLTITGNCGALTVTVSPPTFSFCGTIAVGGPPWVAASASGNSVTVTALSNSGSSPRTGTIVIGSAAANPTSVTIAETGNTEPILSADVRALYQDLLGRDPDAGGFAFWTGTGVAGLGQMGDAFLTSTEAFNSDFAVMAAYQAATGAPPIYAQFAPAIAAIRSSAETISGLYVSLLGANAATSPSAIETLYMNLLNRQPSPVEVLAAETNSMEQNFAALIGYPATTGIAAPIGSAANEFQSTGGFDTDHTNRLYITMLYFTILNRDPDPSGLAFWVTVANSGGTGILFQGAAGFPTRIQILGTGVPGEGFLGPELIVCPFMG
jgi:Domain of unknown function (DUF4214)